MFGRGTSAISVVKFVSKCKPQVTHSASLLKGQSVSTMWGL